MKQPKLRVIPVKQTNKEKRMAKMAEKWINFHWKNHHEFVTALMRARMFIEEVYGIKTINQPWDLIMNVYINQVFKK